MLTGGVVESHSAMQPPAPDAFKQHSCLHQNSGEEY